MKNNFAESSNGCTSSGCNEFAETTHSIQLQDLL